MKNRGKIAFVMVTLNSITDLDGSIGRLTGMGLGRDIYVVDNGSIDGTADRIAAKWPQIQLLRMEFNLGYGSANNLAMRRAVAENYDFICLLNPDVIIQDAFFRSCVQILENSVNTGIVGPVVLEADQIAVIQCAGGRVNRPLARFPYLARGKAYTPTSAVIPVDYVLGAAMVVKRQVIDSIGYFDEEFFPAYVEEVDYCYRAKLAGFGCAVVMDASIRHIGQRAAGSKPKEFRRLCRNRANFALKHNGPLLCATALISIALSGFWGKLRYRT